jgi:glycine cleavage system transcriptional repressor
VAHVAVTAFGVDRPGIVAAVTGVLVDHDGNLEDTAMTILGGHFAMMLVVSVPDDRDPRTLEQALAREVDPLGLTVAVRPLGEEGAAPPAAGSSWAVSVHGADRPGIVHAVSRSLAEHGANIVDLATRVVGGQVPPAYVMLLEVTLAPEADAAALQRDLDALGAELGVEVHVRRDDADIL